MSFLAPTGSQWRTPQWGKNVIVTSQGGKLVAQSWPRKRGPAKTSEEKARQLFFSLFNGLIKRLHPRESEHEREALRNHNRNNRGQRGSAAIRLRDWQMQRLYGRGILIDLPDGLKIYPPGISRDAARILDHVAAAPGSLLTRGTDEWTSTDTGQAEQVLMAGSAGSLPSWQTF